MVLDAVALPAPRTIRDQSVPASSGKEAAFYPKGLAASDSRFTPRPDFFALITARAWPHTIGSRPLALPPYYT